MRKRNLEKGGRHLNFLSSCCHLSASKKRRGSRSLLFHLRLSTSWKERDNGGRKSGLYHVAAELLPTFYSVKIRGGILHRRKITHSFLSLFLPLGCVCVSFFSVQKGSAIRVTDQFPLGIVKQISWNENEVFLLKFCVRGE